MDGVLQMVEGDMAGLAESDVVAAQQWETIERAGFSFAGRFMPHKEIDEAYIDSQLAWNSTQTYEAWLTQVSTTLIETEVNVQLGKIQCIPPTSYSFYLTYHIYIRAYTVYR